MLNNEVLYWTMGKTFRKTVRFNTIQTSLVFKGMRHDQIPEDNVGVSLKANRQYITCAVM